MLTLAIISPVFYARGRASFKHGGGVITSSLTNAMSVLCCKRMMRRKRKVRKKGIRKKEREKNEKEII
jgi:hypothetical protein